MANSLYFAQNQEGVTVNPKRPSEATAYSVTFDSQGYVEADPTDTDLLAELTRQNAALVDQEGTEEALTDGTVQTATTLSALVIRNGAATTILNVKTLDTDGALILGPITIAANAERVIVFPEQITGITGGVFIETPTGALNATPGFLIP